MTRQPQIGTPAPWFYAKSSANPRFCFDSVAGRYVALTFLGSAADPLSRDFFAALAAARHVFDDFHASWFGVSIDPQDEGRVADSLPGIRFFFDGDLSISRLYGMTASSQFPAHPYERATFLCDERLRILSVLPLTHDPVGHVRQLTEQISALPRLAEPAPAQVQAPILVVPRIFEPELCQTLINYYHDRGGKESGAMRDIAGKTVEVFDYHHKRRRDAEIEDEALRRTCMIRIHDRLVPEIKKAFQFDATRIERYLVACYEAEVGGHFRAHRDNTTQGTAHRRFAVSLNLNTGEYEGGQLCFPEFGRQLYTPPAGGAVVFSCSLLHEASPVTSGKRFVFLPFLYDEVAARTRQQYLASVAK